MADTFEIPDQRRESRPHEPCFLQILGPRSTVALVAINALLGRPSMLFNTNGNFFDFDLLQDLIWLVSIDQCAATTRASGIVMNPAVINFFRLKGSALVSRVPRLASRFAFPLGRLRTLRIRRGFGWRIYNVAGRWLR